MIDPRIPEPRMREEFRLELRARLMREAPVALAPRRGTAWTFFRPAMSIGLAGLLLVAGAGTAAAGSVSGDAAFPLKKAFEQLQVTLTFDEVQRVELLAQIADRRLADLQTVADRQDQAKAPTASEEFAEALARFRAAVDALQRAAPAEKAEKVQDLVDAARGKHEAVLDAVQGKLESDTARDAIQRAKTEEARDTESERDGDRDEDPRTTPRRTPTPARTLRPSGERGQTPRINPSPRATEHRDSD